MSRSRNLLHKSKLAEFAKWLEGMEFVKEKTKGLYEVLRMRSDYSGVLIIYDRNDAKEHYTTFGIGNRLVRTWLAQRNNTTTNKDKGDV